MIPKMETHVKTWWQILSSLILFLAKVKPKIDTIKSIEFTPITKKGYDYRVIVKGTQGAEKSLFEFRVLHRDDCTFEFEQ